MAILLSARNRNRHDAITKDRGWLSNLMLYIEGRADRRSGVVGGAERKTSRKLVRSKSSIRDVKS